MTNLTHTDAAFTNYMRLAQLFGLSVENSIKFCKDNRDDIAYYAATKILNSFINKRDN